MAESALSTANADALSGTTDTDTDLVYPTIGESTYYTKVYQLVQRLLQLTRAANKLRVYKDGALTFGIRAGEFMNAATLVEYAGATGQAVNDDTDNYIYLTIVSGVVTVNNSYGGSGAGFPDPSVTEHVPLAIITAASGAYDHDDIDDQRSLCMYQMLT